MSIQGIPLSAREPIPFTPAALQKRYDNETGIALQKGLTPPEKIVVSIRIPTPYEKDAWAATMVRGGVVHYSKKQIRDTFMAGLAFLTPEKQFEEARAGMEQLFLHADAQEVCNREQIDRYLELQEQNAELPEKDRLTDEAMLEDAYSITPTMVLPEQRRVQLQSIQMDIQHRYEPLGRMLADLAEQQTRTRWLSIELYVSNWTGLPYTPVGNGRGGITRVEAEWLHRQIGGDAFDQIGDFIYALHGIDTDDEKNLALLIESSSGLIGSTAPESMGSSVLGSSKEEPSIATPDTGSQTTTD